MHHATHVDEHRVIEDRDSRSDEAFLNDDAMAKDHGIEDSSEGAQHHILELLLDTLRLSHVHRLDEENVVVLTCLLKLHDLGVDVVLVTDEKHKLAQVALEELLGNGRSNSARSTSKKDTLTLELLFEIKRGEIALSLLLGLRHDLASSLTGALYLEEVSHSGEEISDSK